MKTYDVYYGDDLRFLSKWRCEAESPGKAKALFREEKGYSFIKIQDVKENKDIKLINKY